MEVAEMGEVRPPEQPLHPPAKSSWWGPLALFGSIAVVLSLVVWMGARHEVSDLVAGNPTDYWGWGTLRGWARYDANWYVTIASEGYSYFGPTVQSAVAFFPGYPLAIWAVHSVTQLPLQLSGMLITLICGAGIAVLFHRWCLQRLRPSAAWTALVVLLVYPYAWFLYGAVYGDALFVLAILAAFMLLEHDHPIWAGLVGALATGTRPLGVALIVGLVAVVAFKRQAVTRDDGRFQLHLGRFRRGDYGVLLSVTGLLGWMVYLWVRFGEPLAFQQVQQAPGWDQGGGPHTWFKIGFLGRFRRVPEYVTTYLDLGTNGSWWDLLYTCGIILQALLMVGAVLLLWVVWRRIGWGYAIYAASALAIPLLGTKDFQGAGRYVLAAFPCFAAFGLLLDERPRLRVAWLAVSAILLVVLAFLFGRGYYVG